MLGVNGSVLCLTVFFSSLFPVCQARLQLLTGDLEVHTSIKLGEREKVRADIVIIGKVIIACFG